MRPLELAKRKRSIEKYGLPHSAYEAGKVRLLNSIPFPLYEKRSPQKDRDEGRRMDSYCFARWIVRRKFYPFQTKSRNKNKRVVSRVGDIDRIVFRGWSLQVCVIGIGFLRNHKFP